jgi:rSAM/selenodomain-associated transferase 1
VALALSDRDRSRVLTGGRIETLLVFVKAPRPGSVKTRLARAIGDELASDLYRALADLTVKETADVRSQGIERRFCFTPAGSETEVRAWLGPVTLEVQSEGDLGARMDHAFANSFARGSSTTVLIGTDAPTVGAQAVLDAFVALAKVDVVLREASDGGYTLIGLRAPQPRLFHDVAWSTPHVLSTTRERAATLGLTVGLHGPDRDIDTIDDLRDLFPEIRPRLTPDLADRLETALWKRS